MKKAAPRKREAAYRFDLQRYCETPTAGRNSYPYTRFVLCWVDCFGCVLEN